MELYLADLGKWLGEGEEGRDSSSATPSPLAGKSNGVARQSTKVKNSTKTVQGDRFCFPNIYHVLSRTYWLSHIKAILFS